MIPVSLRPQASQHLYTPARPPKEQTPGEGEDRGEHPDEGGEPAGDREISTDYQWEALGQSSLSDDEYAWRERAVKARGATPRLPRSEWSRARELQPSPPGARKRLSFQQPLVSKVPDPKLRPSRLHESAREPMSRRPREAPPDVPPERRPPEKPPLQFVHHVPRKRQRKPSI